MNISRMTHLDEADYIELPRYGGRARERRMACKWPVAYYPTLPNYQVKFVFRDVTFRTVVEAVDMHDAVMKAKVNLTANFWPEHRLRVLGPILRTEVYWK